MNTIPTTLQPWQFIGSDGRLQHCSWCQQVHQVTPRTGENHGICRAHKLAMKLELERLAGPAGQVEGVTLSNASPAASERSAALTGPASQLAATEVGL